LEGRKEQEREASRGIACEHCFKAPCVCEPLGEKWQLVNETLGSGYAWFDPLPWPPAPPEFGGGWTGFNGLPVVAYLLALGERQRKFEHEVRSRLGEMKQRLSLLEQSVVNLELNTQSLFRKTRELGERTIGMAKF